MMSYLCIPEDVADWQKGYTNSDKTEFLVFFEMLMI